MTKKNNKNDYLPDDSHKIKELEQQEKIAEEYKQKYTSAKKNYFIIILVAIAIVFIFSITSFITNSSENNDYEISYEPLHSQFVIQNLKGDTIDTWIAWKIVEDDLFHVHVIDSIYATEKRLDAINDVIMSTNEIEINDLLLHKGPKDSVSTYYEGWFGALNSIDDNTESPIPKNLHFHVSDKGEGDILIDLNNLSNLDGYSGYTKAIVDQEQNQILKSTITIYDIDSIDTANQLTTILRHELGHGFGLAHSSAPEDLMAPIISTNYPYISQCDVDAITLLYDNGQQSQVICEK